MIPGRSSREPVSGTRDDFVAQATLLVIQGVDQGSRFELGPDPATGVPGPPAVSVGRGVRNEIRVLDTEVSRQHALIRNENGRWMLSDRNSANGTFVNGQQTRLCELKHGDQIQVGRTVFLFTTTDEPRAAEPASNRVSFLAPDHPDDRSHIIAAVDGMSAQTLLDRTAPAERSDVAQSLASLQTLYRISEEAASPYASLDDLMRRILDLSIEAIAADRGCLLLKDPNGHLVPWAFGARGGRGSDDRMPVSRSIVDYVMQNGTGVRTSDARTDQRFEPGQSIVQAGIREAICVPLQGRVDLLGVLYLDTTTPSEKVLLDPSAPHRFTDAHLRLLLAIGRQSALAVESSRYQQALVKAERLAAMGQTIAVLSHHIKNILQGVRGGSYLIDMGLRDHKEDLLRKGWAIVEKNQNKIYHLVMDMLTFSKERKPVMQAADLNATVADVCELMQSRAEECGVILTADLSQVLPPAMFDAENIHRAVLNIVTNAIDAVEGMPEGQVLVRTGQMQGTDHVYVAVSDNGPGIAPEQLPRLFNIFESTKGARGTGLGLAVSQKILREHGGEITVESRPGSGSRFVLSWPRLDEDHRSLDGQTRVGDT
ncbi:MAG: FHA domain-containing protein [Planctomycetaceae bacterium]|nr:FHA domain-containing protein [Planctomycetaceae bacterium]